MYIQISELAAVVREMEDQLQDLKVFVSVDKSLQMISVRDLYFFETEDKVNAFEEFNESRGKEVITLLLLHAYGYIEAKAFEAFSGGIRNAIYVDLKSLAAQNEIEERLDIRTELESEMEAMKWSDIKYEYRRVDDKKLPFDELISFNRLEFLMETLSAHAQLSIENRQWVEDITRRYWTGYPMEKEIQPILDGRYAQINQPIISNHKNESMNVETFEYLKERVRYTGFGEGLNNQLERGLKEGLPEFTVYGSHEFGKDRVDMALHFSRSSREGSEKYFFNRYEIALKAEGSESRQMFFINNKGQSITLREAYNLMKGRSVFKELTPKEGARYNAWLKLDFQKRDEHGNAKLQTFNENYGFDLKEAVGRLPLKELKEPDKLAKLFEQLQKGDLVEATLLRKENGETTEREVTVLITADPKYKSMQMFDMEGRKLHVPGPKHDTRYGQAPVDEKRIENGTAVRVGEVAKQVADNLQTSSVKPGEAEGGSKPIHKNQNLLPKRVNNQSNLLQKKKQKNKKGRSIS